MASSPTRKSFAYYTTGTWRRKLVAWGMLFCYLTQPVLASAEAVADTKAPPANTPTVQTAPNGVPVVQIAAPTPGGVSHNLYQTFNVDPNGLILNNSYNYSQTQLAGYIMGNSNLAGGPARIILNEVTSTNPSYLRGYTEVAGKKAEVILANPNGIYGDGFGFINTSRAVLTTGTPVFGGSGSLEAFRVTKGNITVEGKGLASTETDQVDLISRAVAVNAGIWTKDLNIVTGANNVQYDNVTAEKIIGDELQPTVALDVSALGGMYANKIRLIGTDKGVGVNSQGTLAASGGELVLSQNGKISLNGTVSAAGNLTISSSETIHNSGTIYAGNNSIVSTSGTIENQGAIAAGQNTVLSAADIDSNGILAAGIDTSGKLRETGNLTLRAAGQIRAQGQNLAGGNLDMTGMALDLQGAVTYAGQGAMLEAASGSIDNRGGAIGSAGTLKLTTTGDIQNMEGKISSKKELQMNAQNLHNANGEISSEDKLTILAAGVANQGGVIKSDNTLELTAGDTVDNQAGQIEAGAGLEISAQTLQNQGGRLISLDGSRLELAIDGELINTAGTIGGNGRAAIRAGQIHNDDGQMMAQDNMDIIAKEDIHNSKGQITGGKDVTLTAAAVNNGQGKIKAGRDLTITGDTIASQGILQAQNNLRIQARQALNNSGAITAGQDVEVTGESIDSNGLLAAGVTADGSVGETGDLTINAAKTITATGNHLAGGSMAISGEAINLNEADTYAREHLSLTATGGDIQNSNGDVTAGKGLYVKAAGSLINEHGSISGSQTTISADAIINQNGQIRQSGNGAASIVAGGQLDNRGGRIVSNGENLTVIASSITNNQGKIQQAGAEKLVIQSGDTLDNAGGEIATNGQASIIAGDIYNDEGTIFAQRQMEVKANSLQNHKGQLIGKQAVQILAETVENRQGRLEASHGLMVTANSLDNDSGNIINLDDSELIINAGQKLKNASGLLGGNGNVHVFAAQLDNTGGQLSAKQNLNVTTSDQLNNTGGILSAGNDLSIKQVNGSIINKQGAIQAGSVLELAAGGADVAGGSFIANHHIHIGVQNLAADKIQAGENITIETESDFSNNGQTQANGSLTVNAGGKVINTGNLMANQTVRVTSDRLLNEKGAAIKSGRQLELTHQEVNNQGTIYAKEAVTLEAANTLITDGTVASGTDLTVTANTIDSTGSLVAGLKSDTTVGTGGNLTLKAGKLVAAGGENLAGGKIIIEGSGVDLSRGQTAGQSVNITATAGDVKTSEGKVTAQDDLIITAAGGLVNDEALLKAGTLQLTAKTISNRGGTLAQVSQNDFTLTAADLDNTDGQIAVNSENVTIRAGKIQNSQGKIQHAGNGELAIQSDNDLDNTGGEIVGNGQVHIRAGNLDNTRGIVFARQQMNVQADKLVNRNGQAVGEQGIKVTVKEIDNVAGLIEAGNGLDITGQSLVNDDGKITSLDESGLEISLEKELSNQSGFVGGNGSVNVKAASVENTAGQIKAKKNLTVTSTSGLKNTSGVMAAGDTLTVQQTAGNVDNKNGLMQAGQVLDVSAAGGDLKGGSFLAGKEISIQARNLASDNLQADEDANLDVQQDFINDGQVHVNGTLEVAAGGTVYNAGSMTGLGNVRVTGSNVTNAAEAAIKSGNRLEINGKELNNRGTIYGKEQVMLTADNRLTNSGTIAGGSDVMLTASALDSAGMLAAGMAADGMVKNEGDLALKGIHGVIVRGTTVTGGDLLIEGATVTLNGTLTQAGKKAVITATGGDVENSSGRLTAKEILEIKAKGKLVNAAGTIEAAKLDVNAGSINNSGGILAQSGESDLAITTEKLDNTGGLIASNSTNLTIAAKELENTQGDIKHAGNGALMIKNEKELVNRNGQIISNGRMQINAINVDNTGGEIVAQHQLAIQAKNVANQGGRMISRQDIEIAGDLDNRNGLMEAGHGFTLSGQALLNDSGSIISLDPGGLQVSVTGKVTNTSGVIGGNGAVTVTAGQLDNAEGKISAKTDLAVNIVNDLINRKGMMAAGSDLNVTQTGGTIENEDGTVQAGQNLMIAAAGANLSGGSILAGKKADISTKNVTLNQLQAGTDVRIETKENFHNRGQIQANGALNIVAGEEVTNEGLMVGINHVGIAATKVMNAGGAAVKSGGQLDVRGETISNQGTVYGKGKVTVKADHMLITKGAIAGDADVELNAKTVESTGTLAAGLTSDGAVGSTGNLVLTAGGNVMAKGQNLAGGNLTIQGASVDISGGNSYAGHSASIMATEGNVDNHDGNLAAKDSLTIVAKEKLENHAATVKGNQLQITAGNIDNRKGTMVQYGQTDLTINTGNLDNGDGQIAVNSVNFTLNADYLDNSQGKIQHAGTGILAVHTRDGLINTNGETVSNGAVDLNAQTLNNRQGTVSAKNNLNLVAGSLDNQSGVIVSNSAVNLNISDDVNNLGGMVEAGKKLTITAKNIQNEAGKLTSLDQSGLNMMVARNLNNRSGLIGGNGMVSVTAKELNNSEGQVLSAEGLDVTAHESIDNTGGKLASGQNLAIGLQDGTLVNDKGTMEAGHNLEIRAEAIQNAQGKFAANADVGLTFNSLDGAGNVNAGRNLNLTVDGNFINTTGNTWQAVNDLTINASGAVTNDGVMEAGSNLKISGSQVANHAKATMTANKELSITAAGDVINSGSLFGNDVKIQGSNIRNINETAAIAATNSVKLYAVNGLENKDGALVYSMGDIDIAGSEIKNDGGYTTKTKSLLNQSATIEADGDIVIHADEVVNKKREFELEQMVLTSDTLYPLEEGLKYDFPLPLGLSVTDIGYDFLFNSRMKVKRYTFQGYQQDDCRYEYYLLLRGQSNVKTRILKDSPIGKIIASRNLTLQAKNILNDNSWLLAAQNLFSSGNVTNRSVNGDKSMVNHYALVGVIDHKPLGPEHVELYVHSLYDEIEGRELTPESTTTALFGGGQQVNIDGVSVDNVIITPRNNIGLLKNLESTGNFDNAAIVNDSNKVTVNTGINTSVSGNEVQGPAIVNIGSVAQNESASKVEVGVGNAVSTNVNTHVCGNVVQGPKVDIIDSIGQADSVTAVEIGKDIDSHTISSNVLIDKPAIDIASIQSGTSIPDVSQVVSSETSIKAGLGISNTNSDTIAVLVPTVKTEIVKPPQTNNGGTIVLPQNGLYIVMLDPSSKYMVETNPKFVNYKSFISSDYLLGKLNYDPAVTMKRLGDGFYEQKLIREKINELTGRVFLNGYDSAEEQYQALLQNGAAAADNLHLQVGVALSAEQQAALTTDLVWLVEQEVSGQKVLVPVVYLSALREGELTNSGAIISADKVQIKVTGDVTNTSIIRASENTKIRAANVNNIGGSIDSAQLTQVIANQDIQNLSGNISGKDIALSAGKDIISQTYTNTTENKYLSKTIVSDTAAISAGNMLTAVAGQNLILLGADVDAGSNVNLSAQNVNIGTITDINRIKIGHVSEEVSNLGTTITAGENLNLQASQDMNIQATKLSSNYDLTLMAGNDLNLAATANSSTFKYNINAYNFNDQATVSNQLTSLEAGSALTMVSGGNMILKGTRATGDTITALSGGDLALNSVTNSDFSGTKSGNSRNYQRNMNYDEINIGTNLASAKDITLTGGSIVISGSSAVSEEGNIKLTADNDITIEEVTEKHESLTEYKKTKSGFLSKKTTVRRDYSLVNDVIGSNLSGEQVTVTSGADLTVKGSNILGTNGVTLTAADTINLTSAAETGASEHYSYTKKSGLFSGGGLGFTIGSQSTKITTKEQVLGQVGSTIGSLKGDISLTAGEQFKSEGTTLVSGHDLSITGKDIILDNTINIYDSQTKFEFKQSGLSVSLKGGIIDLGTSAYNNLERSGQVQDERLKALYDYKAFKDLKKIKDQLSKGVSKENLKTNVSLNVSLGSTKTTSEQTVHVETVNISNITADGEVTIKATDGDIFLKGTKINAQDITLDAAKDIDIQSAENKQQTTTNTNSSSWSVGGSIGSGFFGNVSKGSGKENGNATTHTESILDASDTLTLKSGEDTNILGSQVKGKTVAADIKGDLNIASRQDTDDYTAKNHNSGLGFTTGLSKGITGSTSKGKTDSTYASVTDQAGIYAGEGGFNIEVGKNTDLKGAVIASEATPDKNKLSTDTLTYSDIKNKADYSASSVGISVNTTKNAKYNEKGITPDIGVPAKGDASSTTKSAISPGTIEVRSNSNQDISNLSRDTTNAVNTLDKIFDQKSVQEKQELSKLFGELAYEEVHKISDRAKDAAQRELDKAKQDKNSTPEQLAALQVKVDFWNEGGANKIALHALVGGIMSDLGGNEFASGAVGAGVNEAVQKELSKITDPDLHQWASAVVGGAAASVVGGNTQTGASTSVSGTKYNRQYELELEARLAKAAGTFEPQKSDAILIEGAVGAQSVGAFLSLPQEVRDCLSLGGSAIYDRLTGEWYFGGAIGGGGAPCLKLPSVTGGIYGLDFLNKAPKDLDQRREWISANIQGIGGQTTLAAGVGVTGLFNEGRELVAVGVGIGLDISWLSVGNTQ